MPAPVPDDKAFHPLFNVNQKKHFEAQRSDEYAWKTTSKPVPGYHEERVTRPGGKKFPDTKFSETKDHFEKKHMVAQAAETTKTNEDGNLQKRTFVTHNRKTTNEHGVEGDMTRKGRITTLAQQRANMPMASLGDKNYHCVDYQPGFFLEGGLVPGSTNQMKARNTGSGKAVDFYSGLKLDGPLNPKSKNYATVCKEQEHHMEVTDVADLRKWERSILQEYDEKYDPDDDSSDEEAIAVRKQRQEAKAAKEAAEAETKAAPKGKK